MEAFKIAVKLFVAQDTFTPDEFLPVFHRLIQAQGIEDHLLIDVADYAHVPEGPGAVLVSSQANIHMDRGEDRLGLLYSRKLPIAGSFRDRLRGHRADIKIALQLQQDQALAGRLNFRTDEIVIRLNDRLLAPNNEKTLAEVKPDIVAIADKLYAGKPVTIEPKLSPIALFEVRLKSAASEPVATLLERISG